MAKEIEENINTWISQIETEYKAANSVDCVIFGYDEEDDSLKVLVLECNMPPFVGLPSLVGDLVRPTEDLDNSALRILEQRTGIKDLYLEQVATFGNTNRHPLGRVISTAYYALLKVSDYIPLSQSNTDKVKWMSIKDISEMAFDHKNILEVCVERLKKAVRQKPIGFTLLPKMFTLKQLQSVYEVILGIKLDKRNFRRKLKNFEILIEHQKLQKDVNHRPAKYYSFNFYEYNKREKEGYGFEL